MNQAVDTPVEQEIQGGITEDQAVSNILAKWEKKEAAKTPATEVPADEQVVAKSATTETETEQPQGDATEPVEDDAEEAASGDIEIDVAGEKFSVPRAFESTAKRIQAKAKEVEAGATRKFMEAADLRKSAETQIESAKQLQLIAEANAELLGDHKMVSRRLQQLESINIAETDTDTLARLNAEYNQLQAAQKRIGDTYQRNIAAQKEQQGKAFTAKRDHAEKQLAARLKGWGPEHAKKLAEYASSKGFTSEELGQISDARFVEVLDDAAYGRQMREAKPQTDKRVAEATKTLRPGAGTSKQAVSAKVDAAVARAKKTGTVEDAAMAWLARSAQRKR
jgi:chemotaxis protein histidine kinase CheA